MASAAKRWGRSDSREFKWVSALNWLAAGLVFAVVMGLEAAAPEAESIEKWGPIISAFLLNVAIGLRQWLADTRPDEIIDSDGAKRAVHKA